MASFLVRKWKHAHVRREEAQQKVLYSLQTPEFLHLQWQLQVQASTQPLPRMWPYS